MLGLDLDRASVLSLGRARHTNKVDLVSLGRRRSIVTIRYHVDHALENIQARINRTHAPSLTLSLEPVDVLMCLHVRELASTFYITTEVPDVIKLTAAGWIIESSWAGRLRRWHRRRNGSRSSNRRCRYRYLTCPTTPRLFCGLMSMGVRPYFFVTA
jgi:hypothetical protein